jgi:hypothetical protein
MILITITDNNNNITYYNDDTDNIIWYNNEIIKL